MHVLGNFDKRRSCPKCGHRVPKTQFYAQNWVWTKWPCPGCGSTLGFNVRRRFLHPVANGITLVTIYVLHTQAVGWPLRWLFLVPVILITVWIFDEVVVKRLA